MARSVCSSRKHGLGSSRMSGLLSLIQHMRFELDAPVRVIEAIDKWYDQSNEVYGRKPLKIPHRLSLRLYNQLQACFVPKNGSAELVIPLLKRSLDVAENIRENKSISLSQAWNIKRLSFTLSELQQKFQKPKPQPQAAGEAEGEGEGEGGDTTTTTSSPSSSLRRESARLQRHGKCVSFGGVLPSMPTIDEEDGSEGPERVIEEPQEKFTKSILRKRIVEDDEPVARAIRVAEIQTFERSLKRGNQKMKDYEEKHAKARAEGNLLLAAYYAHELFVMSFEQHSPEACYRAEIETANGILRFVKEMLSATDEPAVQLEVFDEFFEDFLELGVARNAGGLYPLLVMRCFLEADCEIPNPLILYTFADTLGNLYEAPEVQVLSSCYKKMCILADKAFDKYPKAQSLREALDQFVSNYGLNNNHQITLDDCDQILAALNYYVIIDPKTKLPKIARKKNYRNPCCSLFNSKRNTFSDH